MVNGIDVSQWQGVMDWEKALSAGVQFAFIRATFGRERDVQFARNWAETKRLGIPRGAYGWVIHRANQPANAGLFIDILGDDHGELPPVVDFEWHGPLVNRQMPNFSELRAYITRVEELDGRVPIIYSSTGYWRALPNGDTQTWVARYPYWHAQYTRAATPVIPRVFPDWTFWQWSADGNGRGAEFGARSRDICLDRFNGDITDFQQFMGAEVTVPPAPIARYVRVLSTWLRFRSKPSLYDGDTLVVGQGVRLRVTGDPVITDVTYWPVELDGYDGYVSAGRNFTEPV